VPLGLGIGRLVFRALAVAELALAAALTLALVLELGAVMVGAAAWTLTALLWAVLVVQAVLLRPRLHQRALLVLAGGNLPRSRLHLLMSRSTGSRSCCCPALGWCSLPGS
jgi:hypothetical protein